MSPKMICSIIIGVATAILVFAMYIWTIGFLKLSESAMDEAASKSMFVEYAKFFFKRQENTEDPTLPPYYRNYKIWFLDIPFAVAAGAAGAIGACTALLGFVLVA